MSFKTEAEMSENPKNPKPTLGPGLGLGVGLGPGSLKELGVVCPKMGELSLPWALEGGLEELLEVCEEATEGEWFAWQHQNPAFGYVITNSTERPLCVKETIVAGLDWDDAAFIVCAKAYMPCLIEEVRRLRKELAETRVLLKRQEAEKAVLAYDLAQGKARSKPVEGWRWRSSQFTMLETGVLFRRGREIARVEETLNGFWFDGADTYETMEAAVKAVEARAGETALDL